VSAPALINAAQGQLEQFCESGKCFTQGESRITRNVVLNGLEVHKFVPFGTIKRRVQIGVNFGFGFGSLSGESETHRYDVTQIQNQLQQVHQVTIEPAKNLTPLSYVPTIKIQAAVAGIVMRGLKIRAAGGVGFPGNNVFTLTGVYFFRAK
jgi:hypothetical protein